MTQSSCEVRPATKLSSKCADITTFSRPRTSLQSGRTERSYNNCAAVPALRPLLACARYEN